ncbi:hypothetical protein [Legionella fallonii]|uniref:Uncharacterized protein n=1 Tax=Legionella fallonii LLAP-10 TaxID=1212491 RepID=A0A098G646_9GAMM|nr:hypothetical protein [Legionella fallonii]CEG56980.1 exported protein of unknown function [Legionella fallonii LLAP-10]
MKHNKGFFFPIISIIVALFVLNPLYAASNFKITPLAGTTLPTEVLKGGSIMAYFTVTNLTNSTRNGYAVVGLPQTVSQSTNDAVVANLCSNPINLSAKANCILKLVINGPVSSNFAICNGMNCTIAPTLNVIVNSKSCDPIYGPMTLLNGIEETVFNYLTDSCPVVTGGDYADVPVRPFIGANNGVLWFASNSQGYFKTDGVSVSQGAADILALMTRARDSNGQCITWVVSPGQGNVNPIDAYNNELWMTVPYTPDGQNVYSLIHNEYHPLPVNVNNEYGNIVAAKSSDGGNTFQLIQSSANYNMPVIVSPYPYQNTADNNNMTGVAGMFAQSNIIKWGNYYYILVNQDLSILNANAPPGGVCIYRTNNIADPRSWLGFDGLQYSVPLVPRYPSPPFANPEQYLCHEILPVFYRFSWSYNVKLNKFIIIGIDTNYLQADGSRVEAFIYTLADLDPITGILTPATNTGNTYKEYFIRQITWLDQWSTLRTVLGQSYPSLLDPTSQQISNNYGPRLVTDDHSFQYSNSSPYIYYTLLFPQNENLGRNRNVVRQALKVENCVP